jgi:hypothetical protein
MPFTAAHPAAALPLRRWCPGLFVWSALLIGTITPDLECFLVLRPEAHHGVTFLGSLYFCLPAGLVLFALFHALVRRPATLLLPRRWREAVWTVARRPFEPTWKGGLSLALSLLIGAWLHQIWDAFTHAGHWGVEALPFLQTTLARFDDYELSSFRLLQHSSSLAGALLLVLTLWRWKRRQTGAPAPSLNEALRVTLLSLLVAVPSIAALVRAIGRAAPHEGVERARQFAGHLAIGGISFTALGLMIYGLAATLFWKRLVTEEQR